MATATGRPPLWRDVRVLAWAFQIVVVAVVVAVVWFLYGNYLDNAEAKNLQHRLRLPRPAGRLPDPVQRLPHDAADAGRHRRGPPQHAAAVDHRHRAGDRARHADRHRPAVAELHPAQRGAGPTSRSSATCRCWRSSSWRSSPIVQNAFPPPNESWTLGPIAVLNVRGVERVLVRGRRTGRPSSSSSSPLLTLWVVARWRRARRRPHRPAGPHRRCGRSRSALVVLVVAWVVLGLGATAPELDGRRVTGGITMTPAYFAALLALVVYTSSHIAEIVRGSIQAVPRGPGRGGRRPGPVRLPAAVVRRAPPGDAHRRAADGNQYLNLTKNSSLAAVDQLPRADQGDPARRRHPGPGRAVVHAAAADLPRASRCCISLIVNLVNRRLAIVER